MPSPHGVCPQAEEPHSSISLGKNCVVQNSKTGRPMSRKGQGLKNSGRAYLVRTTSETGPAGHLRGTFEKCHERTSASVERHRILARVRTHTLREFERTIDCSGGARPASWRVSLASSGWLSPHRSAPEDPTSILASVRRFVRHPIARMTGICSLTARNTKPTAALRGRADIFYTDRNCCHPIRYAATS